MKSLAVTDGWIHGRRDLLRAGGGLALGAGWLPGTGQSHILANESVKPAKACILVYLLGGPPQLDTFDMKPEAAAEIRGPFQPISTNVPGIEVCEHLPHLAKMADRYALMRSVSYPNSNHTPMIYYTLTGRPTSNPEADNDVRPPQHDDFPHIGSIVSYFRGQDVGEGFPGFLAIPEVAVRSSISGEFKRARTPLRGGGSGFLGTKYESLMVNGAPGTPDAVPALVLPEELASQRQEKRMSLLQAIDHPKSLSRSSSVYGDLQEQAVLLTGSHRSSKLEPFQLERESEALRLRYGSHRFGRSALLARRLVEAGVPMVSIHWNEMTICDGWDTHGKNFEGLQTELLPMLDQGLSALLEDLQQRGLLDETLVICMGEFGRTPKINQNAGRDHWGPCSSVLMAGGGIQGGRVVGASDKIAAYPITERIDPVDIHATMYHLLGIDPESLIRDSVGRPWGICTGRVVEAVL